MSKLSQDKKHGRYKFQPNIKDWSEACKICPTDRQIAKYFSISHETFYAFLDRERVVEDNGKTSEYIDIYKRKSAETKKKIADAFLENVGNGDVTSIIFGMKAYNGVIEAKDIAHIELKKIDQSFKNKQFLTDMAKEFNLTYEQLNDFANKYFKDSKIEDV